MKQRFAALFLAAMLLCALLAGCGPSGVPSDPGSNGSNTPSGDTNSGSDTDDSNGGQTDAPKLQPSLVMETYNAYHNAADEDVVSFVFRATNPNPTYSVSLARVNLTLKDSTGNVQETTYFMLPTIAPNDTIRFAYTYTCKKGVPFDVSYSQPSTSSSSFQTSTDVVRSTDLHAVITNSSTTTGLKYTAISGTVSNTSQYTCNRVRVSVILKKNGKIVSSDFTILGSSIPAGKESVFHIYHTNDIGFNPSETEVIATAW